MAKGGSRYGAGRTGYRVNSGNLRRVDIRHWQKYGYLTDGSYFQWQWTLGAEVTGRMAVWTQAGAVRLSYSIGGRDSSQTIAMTNTKCHLGGSRAWFVCPRCHCRAAILYLRASRFACRHCQRVSYLSQSHTLIDRLGNRLQQLEQRLELGKPKWQRWATFNRLEDKCELLNDQFDDLIAGKLLALNIPNLMLD
jgi:hypothetical protein